jgi:outer membrane lipoprotein-sorting protein
VDFLDKDKGGQLPKDILLQYSNLYDSEYLGEEKMDGNKVHVLKLKPRDEEELIVSMKVWVDADKLFTRKIEQIDINENINRYVVSNFRENVELSEALFRFEVPKGVEVVDMTEAE